MSLLYNTDMQIFSHSFIVFYSNQIWLSPPEMAKSQLPLTFRGNYPLSSAQYTPLPQKALGGHSLVEREQLIYKET